MDRDLITRICVRTRLWIEGEKKNQGSGLIIQDGASFCVLTAHHCIYGENDDFAGISKDDIWIDHQKEDYKSSFTRIEVDEIVGSNKDQDWALLRIKDPGLNIDFSKVIHGIPTEEGIEVKFCGYQQANPETFRPFDANLLSISEEQFRISLKGKSFSQGSEEGSFIAKGLSGSGVGIEIDGILYLIGILKSVLGDEALNDDIECCAISCLDDISEKPSVELPEITTNDGPLILENLLKGIDGIKSILDQKTKSVEPKSIQSIKATCRIQFIPGRAMIVELPGKQCGIIDCDRRAVPRVLGYLKFRAIKELSFVAISHWHSDAYSGFLKILSAVDKVKYAFIPDPGLLRANVGVDKWHREASMSTKLLSELERRHASKDLSLYNSSGGMNNYPFAIFDEIKDSVSISTIAPMSLSELDCQPIKEYPHRGRRINQNRYCTVFQIKVGEHRFLITSDTEIKAWEEIFQYAKESEFEIRSDGITLPHYGSRYGLSQDVLKQITKGDEFYAVVERNRRFKLPDPKILEMVRNSKGKVEVYDDDSITVIMNLEGLSLIGEK